MATVTQASARISYALRSLRRSLQSGGRSAPPPLVAALPQGLRQAVSRSASSTAKRASVVAEEFVPQGQQQERHASTIPVTESSQEQQPSQAAPGQGGQAQAQPSAGQGGQLQAQQSQSGAIAQPRRAGALAPGFTDLLSPWFPGDRSLTQMLSTVDRMFEDMMAPGWPFQPARAWPAAARNLGALDFPITVRPPWDVQEDEHAYHMRFDLPGMSKDEVNVRVDSNHVLHISAEHSAEEKAGDVLKSRVARKYQTSLQLPEEIGREDISAEMKNGVLSVTVPKKPEAEPEVHDVPVA